MPMTERDTDIGYPIMEQSKIARALEIVTDEEFPEDEAENSDIG